MLKYIIPSKIWILTHHFIEPTHFLKKELHSLSLKETQTIINLIIRNIILDINIKTKHKAWLKIQFDIKLSLNIKIHYLTCQLIPLGLDQYQAGYHINKVTYKSQVIRIKCWIQYQIILIIILLQITVLINIKMAAIIRAKKLWVPH